MALAPASYKDILEDFTKEDWKKVRRALKLLGVENLAYKPIGKLSGGQ